MTMVTAIQWLWLIYLYGGWYRKQPVTKGEWNIYPVVNRGSGKRSELGVLFPTNMHYEMGSQLEQRTEFCNHLIDDYETHLLVNGD